MKKKLLLPILLTVSILGTSMTSLACSPLYKPLGIKLPDINIELSDGVKNAVDKAVEDAVKDLDIKLLSTPKITECRYIHSNVFYSKSRLQVRWDEVEDATSYEIMVTKADGTSRTYTSNYTSLIVDKNEDDFITGCPKPATVKVRAVKDDGALYSLWTEEDDVACNAIHFD